MTMLEYDLPHTSIYVSRAVAPGQAITMGDKVFLHPADAHKLRIQLMVNNKEEAVFGPSPDNRRTRGPGHAKKSRKTPPVAARVGAAVLLVGVTLAIFFGCASSARDGAEYHECLNVAEEAGWDRNTPAIEAACLDRDSRTDILNGENK